MLQEIRKKRGLSQSQLSKKSGIPLYTIQKYERGSRDINKAKLETLLKLCIALDCCITDILSDRSLRKLYNRYLERSVKD